jgi:hypothetical protein
MGLAPDGGAPGRNRTGDGVKTMLSKNAALRILRICKVLALVLYMAAAGLCVAAFVQGNPWAGILVFIIIWLATLTIET